MHVALMFTQFDFYQGSTPQSCSNDFVEVRDGLSDISHNIGGKYCNGNMAMLILTTGNFARVHFLSGSASPSSHDGIVFEYLSVKPGIYNRQIKVQVNFSINESLLLLLLLFYYIISYMCPLVQHLFCKFVGLLKYVLNGLIYVLSKGLAWEIHDLLPAYSDHKRVLLYYFTDIKYLLYSSLVARLIWLNVFLIL